MGVAPTFKIQLKHHHFLAYAPRRSSKVLFIANFSIRGHCLPLQVHFTVKVILVTNGDGAVVDVRESKPNQTLHCKL